MTQRVWRRWSSYKKRLLSKADAVESQVCRYSAITFAFRAWRIAQEKMRRLELRKIREFRSLADTTRLKYCWKRWREYLIDVEFENEVKTRVDATWSKVQKWMK